MSILLLRVSELWVRQGSYVEWGCPMTFKVCRIKIQHFRQKENVNTENVNYVLVSLEYSLRAYYFQRNIFFTLPDGVHLISHFPCRNPPWPIRSHDIRIVHIFKAQFICWNNVVRIKTNQSTASGSYIRIFNCTVTEKSVAQFLWFN